MFSDWSTDNKNNHSNYLLDTINCVMLLICVFIGIYIRYQTRFLSDIYCIRREITFQTIMIFCYFIIFVSLTILKYINFGIGFIDNKMSNNNRLIATISIISSIILMIIIKISTINYPLHVYKTTLLSKSKRKHKRKRSSIMSLTANAIFSTPATTPRKEHSRGGSMMKMSYDGDNKHREHSRGGSILSMLTATTKSNSSHTNSKHKRQNSKSFGKHRRQNSSANNSHSELHSLEKVIENELGFRLFMKHLASEFSTGLCV